MRGCWLRSGLVTLLALVSLSVSAKAETLEVGPGKPFAAPSQAIARAAAGDTVEIAPGEYFDCAVITANRVTVVGLGDGAVLTDKTCQGKAILVTVGRDITLRNLTLQRARVPDENGAGVRAEGANLTVDHVRFIDNEDGILTTDDPTSTVRVRDSVFERNGRCRRQCAHGIYAGRIALLDVEHSRFRDSREGHHIKSRALRTVLLGDDVADGETGNASYLVELPDGGNVVMRDNLLEKGPHTSNATAAVMLGSESERNDSRELVFERNRYTDDTGQDAPFVRNWTGGDVVLLDNTMSAGATAATSRGRWWHRVRRAGAEVRDGLKDAYGEVRHIGGVALRMVGIVR